MFVVLIFTVCIVLFLLSNYFYKKSGYYKSLNEQFTKFLNVPSNTEVINIGSFPSVYCFDWDAEKSVKGFNLGVGPEEIFYDNKMLQFYINRNISEKMTVIHLITPLLFCENKYTKEIPYNIRYACILERKDVNVAAPLFYIEKYFPLGRKLISAVLNRLTRIISKRRIVVDNISPEAQADLMIQGWLEQNPRLNDFKNINQYDANREYVEYQQKQLKELVDFCKLNNLIYIAVIGPVSEYIRAYFSEEFVDRFVRDNLRNVGLGNERILDFYNCEKYSAMSNYSNGLFLKAHSRKEFTKDVVKELQRRGFL